MKADVVVVGAGPLGSAIARYSAGRGRSVLLVGPEAPDLWSRSSLAGGSNDVSRLGHLLDLPEPLVPLAAASREAYRALGDETGIQVLQDRAALTVLRSEALPPGGGGHFDLPVMIEQAARHGCPVELLRDDALADRFPDLHFQPDTVGLLQETGTLIDPRALVAAEQAKFTSSGGRVLRAVVRAVESAPHGLRLHTSDGEVVSADAVVIAIGGYAAHSELLDRRLRAEVYGATTVAARVDDPLPAMPSLMYLDTADVGGFRGLVVPPLRYPDGNLYLKGAGASLRRHPLRSAAEVYRWMSSGGDQDDEETLRRWLGHVLPGVRVGPMRSSPCLVSEHPSGLPYIGQVDERVHLAAEGLHGASLADAVGRLTADLVLSGAWSGAAERALFEPQWW